MWMLEWFVVYRFCYAIQHFFVNNVTTFILTAQFDTKILDESSNISFSMKTGYSVDFTDDSNQMK